MTRIVRLTIVVLSFSLSAVPAANASEAPDGFRALQTTCDPGDAPPCIIEWTLQSRFVDPERVLINRGRPNGSVADSGVTPPDMESGLRESAHELRTVIHLPAGYDGETRFPVLYLLHGQGGHAGIWLNASCGYQCIDWTTKLFERLPAVVVMLEGGEFGFYSNWWHGGRDGSAVSAWERYHLEEVLPAVEENLKIRSGRRWHAIFGISMGGFGAIRYAAQCPDCFGTAGSISGLLNSQDPVAALACGASVGLNIAGYGKRAVENDNKRCEDIWGDPISQAFYWGGHNPMRLTGNLRHTRVYVSHGDGVTEPETEPQSPAPPADQELLLATQGPPWVEAASADGVDVEYRRHDGTHAARWWYADLTDAIERWNIFGRVEERSTAWSFSTVSQHGRVWGLHYDFAAPPEEIISFERNGNVLTGQGSGTVTMSRNERALFTASLPFRVSLPTGT